MRFAQLSFAVLTLTVLASCSQNASDSAGGPPRTMPATSIIAERVVMRQDFDRVESVGTARARLAATIYPQSSGEIIEVGFESGEYVERGTMLARLDSAEQRLDVARAQITLQDAEQLLARYQRIDVDGAVSESQIDVARTAVEAAAIELEMAEEALSKRTIYAPFSGYVGLSDIDPGALITQTTELTRIDDRSEIFVDFALPEQVFGRVNIGDILPMAPFAASGEIVNATVSVVDSRIDPDRRSFMVRATIDNTSDTLRPGMSFRVEFDLPGMEYPSVPEAAIVWGGDGAYLWEVVNGNAQRVPLTIVARQEGSVLVRADLSAGDLIVSEGVQKVRQGAPVSVSEPESAALPVAEATLPQTSAAFQ